MASPQTAYGTISNANGVALAGGNDSGAWGPGAMGFTKWVFQLLGTTSGFTITLYGTIDPNAYLVYTANAANDGGTSGSFYTPGTGVRSSVSIPATSWFILPGPSEQSGTGTISNPISSTSTLFVCSMPLVAVRAVVTAISSPTGSGSVVAFAVP